MRRILKGLRIFVLGAIPVAIILGIPGLAILILGKELFGYVIFVAALIMATFALGLIVDMFLEDIKESRARNSHNSHPC